VHIGIAAFASCAIVHYNKSGGVEIKFNQPWLFGRRSLFNEPERERAQSESAARNRANFNKSRVNNINRTAGRIFIKVSNLRTHSESACAPSVKNNTEWRKKNTGLKVDSDAQRGFYIFQPLNWPGS